MVKVTAELIKHWLPKRRENAHKGEFGRIYVLAGSVGFTGAPYFATEAAVRTGSGLVFLGVPPEIWQVLAVKCNEAMPSPLPSRPDAWLQQKMNDCDAVLIGCGLGRAPETDARTLSLVKTVRTPLVLDADGINAVAEHINVLKTRRDRLTVLTPHEGEFARLRAGRALGGEDRDYAAVRFARDYGVVLVLKGHRTLTAFPDGTLFENTTGNPGMAKGGSGDILSGMIVSLLGQGLPAKHAVPLAVWLHGYAGDLCKNETGEYGMTPSDLLKKIPYAMKWMLEY